MRMPPARASARTVLRYATYTLARLSADPGAADLAERLRPHARKVRTAEQEWRDGREAAIEMMAMRDAADASLDALLAELDATAKARHGRDRDNLVMSKLFGRGGYSFVTSAPLDTELKETDRIVIVLGTIGDEVLASYGPKLAKAAEDLRTARKRHIDALSAAAEKKALLEVAILDFRAVYPAVYGLALDRFPTERRRVDAYFYSARRSGTPAEPEEADEGDDDEPTPS
jgi:hypothetical protein